MDPCFVGIDVAKRELVVAVRPSGDQWTVSNDEVGWDKLVARLKQAQPERIVVEATGGFEIGVATALAAAKLPLSLVNPRKVRNFGRANGQLAKTDRLDAAALALFGERLLPALTIWPEADLQALHEILGRRRQLVAMRSVERERRSQRETRSQASLNRHIEFLTAEIVACEAELLTAIKASPVWKAKYRLLSSVPGVGLVTATTMLIFFTLLGPSTREEVAALVGVAPLNRDSGTLRGQRTIWGGRSEVRRVLYMAAITAKTWNPAIHDLYQRLTTAGKPPKLALIACARKLSHILRAIFLTDSVWRNPNTQA